MSRSFIGIAVVAFSFVGISGCTIQVQPAPVAEEPAPVVEESAGPVITGPGVEVIDVEPDPVERVYVYDPGYPPGVYFYNGFYWYGGYRYEHDVFINRYVVVNVRERRFVDVEGNRRRGQIIEQQKRTEFARTGGHVSPAAVRAHQQAVNHPPQHQQQVQHQQTMQQHQPQPQPQPQPQHSKKKTS